LRHINDMYAFCLFTASITRPGRYTGVYPFDEHRQWQRNAAVLGQLAPLRQRLRRLEDKMHPTHP